MGDGLGPDEPDGHLLVKSYIAGTTAGRDPISGDDVIRLPKPYFLPSVTVTWWPQTDHRNRGNKS